MISIKNAVLMVILSLLTIQNKTQCVFSGFWNKLSNMTGYKFKKEQNNQNNQSSQKNSPTQENNLAIIPKNEEQKTVKTFFNIPASIGNYRIKASDDLIKVITKFKEENRDAIIENRDAIIMVLVAIAESDSSDQEVVSNLANIHTDLDTQKSLCLTQLIQKLAVKSNKNSAVVIAFINEQRGKYTIKDNNGNVDQTANFLKAFEDAKIVFYDLSPLKNKFLNEEPFTEKEYTFLAKNASLIDWIPHNNEIVITDNKSYLERLNLEIVNRGGYKSLFSNLAICLLVIPVEYCVSESISAFKIKSIIELTGLYGLVVYLIHRNTCNSSHLISKTVTIPFQQEDEVVCVEVMDTIIQRAPFTNA